MHRGKPARLPQPAVQHARRRAVPLGRHPLRRDGASEGERRHAHPAIPGEERHPAGHQGGQGRLRPSVQRRRESHRSLDGLQKRMKEYFDLGCRFAKWRAVITIGEGIPTHTCLYANAHALARYAAICQEASIVPMIEPEVLLDGNHSIERSEEVHEATLRATYAAMAAYNVIPEGLVLKTSMVVSGKDAQRQASVAEVAERTVRVLKRTVPAAQPGVVFLSGGQADEAATAHLNAMAAMKGL